MRAAFPNRPRLFFFLVPFRGRFVIGGGWFGRIIFDKSKFNYIFFLAVIGRFFFKVEPFLRSNLRDKFGDFGEERVGCFDTQLGEVLEDFLRI